MMGDQAHTPGPWVRSRHGQLFGANGRQVEVWDAGIAWASRSPETEANARLIAAAPELLEALQTLVYNIEQAWPGLSHLAPLVAARAAISKASPSLDGGR